MNGELKMPACATLEELKTLRTSLSEQQKKIQGSGGGITIMEANIISSRERVDASIAEICAGCPIVNRKAENSPVK